MITELDQLIPSLAFVTDPGRIRPSNEDSAFAGQIGDGVVLLAVADGVGGLTRGDIASSQSIAFLQEALRDQPTDVGEALARAFAEVNRRVYLLASELGAQRIATTLVAAIIRDGKLWIANVGDSRAYLIANGQLQQLSKDHSWVSEQLAAGSMTPEEAATSRSGHVITRAIGAEESVEPEIAGPIEIPAGAAVLLCSDGLYRVLSDEDLVSAVVEGSPSSACTRLVELANAAGGPDNIGIAVFRSGLPG